MTKPFLRTTTALVMMASLTLPAVAQGIDGMTPKDILKGARDGSLDMGFETDNLNRKEVVAELKRLQALCARTGMTSRAELAALAMSLGVLPDPLQPGTDPSGPEAARCVF